MTRAASALAWIGCGTLITLIGIAGLMLAIVGTPIVLVSRAVRRLRSPGHRR